MSYVVVVVQIIYPLRFVIFLEVETLNPISCMLLFLLDYFVVFVEVIKGLELFLLLLRLD